MPFGTFGGETEAPLSESDPIRGPLKIARFRTEKRQIKGITESRAARRRAPSPGLVHQVGLCIRARASSRACATKPTGFIPSRDLAQRHRRLGIVMNPHRGGTAIARSGRFGPERAIGRIPRLDLLHAARKNRFNILRRSDDEVAEQGQRVERG